MLKFYPDQYELFNYLEAGLWFLFSLIFLFKSRNDQINKTTFIALCITLFFFGISDIIEVQTGAWWKPVGLLLLKAGCVVSMIIFFAKYYIQKHSNTDIYKDRTKNHPPVGNVER